MFFSNFFLTFNISSIGCALIDFFYPQKRIKEIEQRFIIGNYLKMLPLVNLNLLSSYPFFNLTGKYLENQEDYDQNSFLYLLGWLITADIIFYSTHYSFHKIKYLYNNYHSIHHQYRYTHGMGAIYAHPVDFICTNLIPTFTWIWILPPSDNMANFIITFSTAYTVIISHGGFKIFSISHLRHHLLSNKNYGLLISDRLMSTKF